MPTDKLYDIAFQFKKAKLWNRLYDAQIFAVRHADGTVGYCCVMGRMGQHLALAVYPGGEGLDSYRRLGGDRAGMDEPEMRELAMGQNCLMCSFQDKEEQSPRELAEIRRYCAARGAAPRGKNAYPRFQRFRPHFFPWYVDGEADQARLFEALEACLEVSEALKGATPEALGFTEGAPFDRSIPLLEKQPGGFRWSAHPLPAPLPIAYPSAEARDELLLAGIRKSAKRGGEWACDVLMHVQPMTNDGDARLAEEPASAPFYPYLLLIVDPKSGMVLGIQVASDPDDYLPEFTRAILETARARGKPARILVRDERTRALFAHLAGQLGAELRVRREIPLLEEVERDFLERFDGDGDSSEDEMERLAQLLGDAKALADMPDEVLAHLAKLAQMGALPDEAAENVNRECMRRGLR